MSYEVDKDLLGDSSHSDDDDSIASFGSLEVDLPLDDKPATAKAATTASKKNSLSGKKEVPKPAAQPAPAAVEKPAAAAPAPVASKPTPAKAAPKPTPAKKKPDPLDDSDDDGSVGSLNFSSDSSLAVSSAEEEEEESQGAAPNFHHTEEEEEEEPVVKQAAPAPAAAVVPEEKPKSAADELDFDLDLGHDDLDFDFDRKSEAGSSRAQSKRPSVVATSATAAATAKRGAYVPPSAVSTQQKVASPRQEEAAAAAAASPRSTTSSAASKPEPAPVTTAAAPAPLVVSSPTPASSIASSPAPAFSGGFNDMPQAEEYRPAVDTEYTTSVARARQAKKEEYAERISSGREQLSQDEQGNTINRQRKVKERPAFNAAFSLKTPISKKLQDEQRNALLYNTTPRTASAKKSMRKPRASPSASARKQAQPQEEKEGGGEEAPKHNDADYSDEEEAMARLDGGAPSGRKQPRPVTSKSNARYATRLADSEIDDAPVEIDENSPWLDSLSAALHAQAGGGHAHHNHRASMIFHQNEPTAAVDVDQLNQSMKQLFELQRTGSTGPTSKTQTPSAKNSGLVRSNSAKKSRETAPPSPTRHAPPQQPSAAAPGSTAAMVASSPQVDAARNAARAAQEALAMALASIRPQGPPVAEQIAEQKQAMDQLHAQSLANSSAEESKEQSPASTSAIHSRSATAGPQTFAFDATSGDSKAQSVNNSFAQPAAAGGQQQQQPHEAPQVSQISPDEYYQQQLRAQQEQIYAAQQAGTYEPVDPSDPFGYFKNSPGAAASQLYLAQLAANSARKLDKWSEVSSSPLAWASLATSASREGDQYSMRIRPGKFSVEARNTARRRAKKQAALVEQLRNAQMLAQPYLHAVPDPAAAGYDGQPQQMLQPNPGLMGLAYSDVHGMPAPHPSLAHHVNLLDGYPLTAQFLAGGGDPNQGQGAAPGGDPYSSFSEGDEYTGDEQDYFDPESDPNYPMGLHSHTQRMEQARMLRANGGLEVPQYGTRLHEHQKQTHTQLKAEVMHTLHAGLFGDELAAATAAAAAYAGVDEAAGARLHDPTLPATHFQFRNAATGHREFLAESPQDAQTARSARRGSAGDLGSQADDALNSSTASIETSQADKAGASSQTTQSVTDAAPYVGPYYSTPSAYPVSGVPTPATVPRHGFIPPEAQTQIIPASLLSHMSTHFAGRDLNQAMHLDRSHFPRITQTSKSETKRRTDKLMNRLFHPEIAKQEDREREEAAQAAAKAARKAAAAKKRAATAGGIVAKSAIPMTAVNSTQLLRDAMGSTGSSGLASVNESMHSNALSTLSEESSQRASGVTSPFHMNVIPPSNTASPPDSASRRDSAKFNSEDYMGGGVDSTSPPSAHGAKGAAAAKQQQQQPRPATAGASASSSSIPPAPRAWNFNPPPKSARESSPEKKKSKKKKKQHDDPADPNNPQVSRLDLLYYKHKITEQKKTQLRAEKAQLELSYCTFKPNLDAVLLKGKIINKSNKKRREMAALAASGRSGAEDDSDSDDERRKGGAPKATQKRLDAMYNAYKVTQDRLQNLKEQADKEKVEAEKAHTFKPTVHASRSVAQTVALANSAYVRGFEEKVGQMRQAAVNNPYRTPLEKWGLRSDTHSYSESMNMSLDYTPSYHTQNHGKMYTHAGGQQVVLSTEHDLDLSKTVVPEPPQAAGEIEPVPQIIMRGVPGSEVPFQMISGTNPQSPRAKAFAPSTNRSSYVQDGAELDATLRRIDGRELKDDVGDGTVEGLEKFGNATISAEAAAAFAAASNPQGLGLGIVLPNHTPGSVIPRELTLHDHVSSYSYQYAKQHILENILSGAQNAPSTASPAKAKSSGSPSSPSTTSAAQATPARKDPASAIASSKETTKSSSSSSSAASASAATVAAAAPAERVVLLFVDIQLGDRTERIVVHKGDSTAQLAAAFTTTHALTPEYTPVIQNMLDQQIAALKE